MRSQRGLQKRLESGSRAARHLGAYAIPAFITLIAIRKYEITPVSIKVKEPSTGYVGVLTGSTRSTLPKERSELGERVLAGQSNSSKCLRGELVLACLFPLSVLSTARLLRPMSIQGGR